MASDKKIEDYLHLYLGCELAPVEDEGVQLLTHKNLYDSIEWGKLPYLRPMTEMSEDEKYELRDLVGLVEYNKVKNESRYAPNLCQNTILEYWYLFLLKITISLPVCGILTISGYYWTNIEYRRKK